MLPDVFCRIPIAHRALHDVTAGRPENSLAAIKAAIDAGYGVEIDLQLSSDGEAMVFHDYDLARLTKETGAVQQRTSSELQQISLTGAQGETIPTLTQVLTFVAGRIPLLIELKDQDGAMGPDIGTLEAATVKALRGYNGPVAVMSFNPHSVALLADLAPDVPRGLTTAAYATQYWDILPPERRKALRELSDFEASSANFISHESLDVTYPRVQELRARGVPVLTWTIKSLDQEAKVRPYVDNVTFEGYLSTLPA